MSLDSPLPEISDAEWSKVESLSGRKFFRIWQVLAEAAQVFGRLAQDLQYRARPPTWQTAKSSSLI
jgi:hypothetical protein